MPGKVAWQGHHRSRPGRPAIRRPRPPNSNGAPPGWVTSAPWSTGGPANARWTTTPMTTCSPPRPGSAGRPRPGDVRLGLAHRMPPDELEVLPAGEQLVNGGVLAREPDHRPDRRSGRGGPGRRPA